MSYKRRNVLVTSLVAVAALGLSSCGSDDEASSSSSTTTSAEASGDTVKVGLVRSLSGALAISETAVRDSELLAIKEINAAGGVLGKQIVPIVEDGETKPEVFAQKAEKLLSSDKVAVLFGGWSSSSRKAMKPVVEGKNALLFYPVQYEGLEVSPNIFYTGATTNQQIVPALDYMKEKGLTKVFLAGSDYVFPRTANKIIKAYAAANGMTIVGEEYIPLEEANAQGIAAKVLAAKPQVVFNTLNGDANVSFFKELAAAGNTSDEIQTISVSIAEEEVLGVGPANLEGHLTAWNYYQTTDTPKNPAYVAAYKAAYGAAKPTADPIEAGYNSVYIWAAAVEKAGTFDVPAVIAAAAGLVLETPEGTLTVHPKNHHVYKTARIGEVQADGLIKEVGGSGTPIEPDPCLDGPDYPWAVGLAEGEARSECDAVK